VVGLLGALEMAVPGYSLERAHIVDRSLVLVAVALGYSRRGAVVLACCRLEVCYYSQHMDLELVGWKMVAAEPHRMLVVLGMVDREMRPRLDQSVLVERHYLVLLFHN
jgi:hypothetical protein